MYGLRLAHLNVRSLLPKLEQVRVLLIDNNFDILVLTETWLHSDIEQHVEFDGYRVVRCDRVERGGGVAIILRDAYQYEIMKAGGNIEQVWIQFSFPGHILYVGGVYRPPQFNCKQFLEEVELISIHF